MGLTFTFRDGTTTENVIEWAMKYEDDQYRHVARDVVGEFALSTIWQGMPSVGMAPNNYETAIFRGGHIIWMTRWSFEEEAVEGHAMTLKLLQDGWEPEEQE